MKTFDFIESAISHHLKDPHSKALEPDCLSPPLAIMTQSLKGEGNVDGGSFFQENSQRIEGSWLCRRIFHVG
jgi:hypothetical protein